MSGTYIPRQFVCTNPNCRIFKEKNAKICSAPAHAKVICDECGYIMVPEGDMNIVFIGPEGPKSNVLSSGFLPIQEEKRGMLSQLTNQQSRLKISDPDIAKYPDISLVRQNPNCVDPNLLHDLQTSMVVLVKDKGYPRSACLIRAPSHYLSSSITESTRLGLHIEMHEVDGIDAYGIYPLIWTNPQHPFFAETQLVPYDTVGVREIELNSPFYHGYQWRKLFYILTQRKVDFILVDERNQIILTKVVNFSKRQRTLFIKLARNFSKYKNKQITNNQFCNLVFTYNRAVNIDGVQQRFNSTDGCYIGTK